MSRTVYYDANGNEVDTEDCINDAPTYAQEQLADLGEKEKHLVTKYKWALYYAACDYSMTRADCSKCNCRNSCKHKPATLGCRFALEDKWKRDAGIKDNQCTRDHQRDDYLPTCAKKQLADAERRETVDKAVDHPDYYKTGGIEAIDVIEAWGLGFNLGNVVKYIARAGRKTADSLQDLRKAAWYLDREIKRRERE